MLLAQGGRFDREAAYMTTNYGGIAVRSTVKAGISFGTALAMVISYAASNSIFWTILHGIFGWVYVILYVLKYGWR